MAQATHNKGQGTYQP